MHRDARKSAHEVPDAVALSPSVRPVSRCAFTRHFAAGYRGTWAARSYALILLTCVFSNGCCRLLSLAYRTTVFEPHLYCTYRDSDRSLDLYSQWADQAWLEEACPTELAGPDYLSGFHDGFIDYVYAGGTGEPPPVPPRVYWNVWLRTESGKERAHQWFEGFRHGARVAREGGYRAMATVESSVLEMPRNAPMYAPPSESPDAGAMNANETSAPAAVPEGPATASEAKPVAPSSSDDATVVPADLPMPAEPSEPEQQTPAERTDASKTDHSESKPPTEPRKNSSTPAPSQDDPKSTRLPKPDPSEVNVARQIPVNPFAAAQNPVVHDPSKHGPIGTAKNNEEQFDDMRLISERTESPAAFCEASLNSATPKAGAAAPNKSNLVLRNDPEMEPSPPLSARVRAASTVLFQK